jgi:ABC-2 type transport system ATP-binding protein
MRGQTRVATDFRPPAVRPPADDGPLLSVSGLSRVFGHVPVIEGIDLQVDWGEAVAVTGPNGSGKTTLLRCVVGADRPSAGVVELCGRPLREHEPDARRRVAAVLDDVEFFADLSIAEHLTLLLAAHGADAPDEQARTFLAEASLADIADHLPAALSSGQRRRLALLTCFVRPRVLVVLDEPEQRLDRAGRAWLAHRLLQEKKLGHGVLMATHDSDLTRAVADRVLQLERKVSC